MVIQQQLTQKNLFIREIDGDELIISDKFRDNIIKAESIEAIAATTQRTEGRKEERKRETSRTPGDRHSHEGVIWRWRCPIVWRVATTGCWTSSTSEWFDRRLQRNRLETRRTKTPPRTSRLMELVFSSLPCPTNYKRRRAWIWMIRTRTPKNTEERVLNSNIRGISELGREMEIKCGER